MNNTVLLLALGMLFFANARSGAKARPKLSGKFQGWQKIFGVVAFVAALLILLNPEFLALGLLGDTAFFDLLVLALSLQMHGFVRRAWHEWVTFVIGVARWLGTPSIGFRYLLFISALFLTSAASRLQKVVERFVS
jgi:uncharacterized membrane protein YkgB